MSDKLKVNICLLYTSHTTFQQKLNQDMQEMKQYTKKLQLSMLIQILLRQKISQKEQDVILQQQQQEMYMVFTLLNQRSDSISSKKLTKKLVYHLYFMELLVSVMKTSKKRSSVVLLRSTSIQNFARLLWKMCIRDRYNTGYAQWVEDDDDEE